MPPCQGPQQETAKERAAEGTKLGAMPKFEIETWDFFHLETFIHKGL